MMTYIITLTCCWGKHCVDNSRSWPCQKRCITLLWCSLLFWESRNYIIIFQLYIYTCFNKSKVSFLAGEHISLKCPWLYQMIMQSFVKCCNNTTTIIESDSFSGIYTRILRSTVAATCIIQWDQKLLNVNKYRTYSYLTNTLQSL